MNTELSERVGVLVGKSLWRCTRAADLASFQFGARRTVTKSRGELKEVGEYALHVQCSWHILHDERIIVGSRDLYYPADYSDEGAQVPEAFDWDRDPNRRDKLLRSLFDDETQAFVVRAVDVTPAAGLHIAMQDGLCLDVFPDDSLGSEYWRLFRPGVDEPHLVVTSRGIEA